MKDKDLLMPKRGRELKLREFILFTDEIEKGHASYGVAGATSPCLDVALPCKKPVEQQASARACVAACRAQRQSYESLLRGRQRGVA